MFTDAVKEDVRVLSDWKRTETSSYKEKKGGGGNRFTFEDTLLLYKYPVAPIIVSIRMRDKTEVRRSDALL